MIIRMCVASCDGCSDSQEALPVKYHNSPYMALIEEYGWTVDSLTSKLYCPKCSKAFWDSETAKARAAAATLPVPKKSKKKS